MNQSSESVVSVVVLVSRVRRVCELPPQLKAMETWANSSIENSYLQSKFTVETIFCKVGTIPDACWLDMIGAGVLNAVPGRAVDVPTKLNSFIMCGEEPKWGLAIFNPRITLEDP